MEGLNLKTKLLLIYAVYLEGMRMSRLQKCTEVTFIIHKLFMCNLGNLVIDNAFNKIIKNKRLVI